MTQMLRTAKVLHHIPIRDGNRVIFRHQDDAQYAPQATAIYVNTDDYLDMGEPDTLTVTIEPGDQLNETTPRVGVHAASATKNRVSGYNPKDAQ